MVKLEALAQQFHQVQWALRVILEVGKVIWLDVLESKGSLYLLVNKRRDK